MTVQTLVRKIHYQGDGSTSLLNVPFDFYLPTDLIVIQRVIATGIETPMLLNVNYTVSGGDGNQGQVTVLDPAVDFPATVTWTIQRVLPRTQELDYVENDEFPAESHEEGLDRDVMLIQELDETLDRALKFPTTDAPPTLPTSDNLNATIPDKVVRALKFLAFDSNGEPIASEGPVAGVPLPAGQVGDILRWDGAAWATEKPSYDLGFFFSGTPAAADEVLRVKMVRPCRFDFSDATSGGSVRVNPSPAVNFLVAKNGSTVTTVTVSTLGAFTFSPQGIVAFAKDDVLTVVGPAAPNTIEDIGMLFAGTRD